ncbi:hypothetical protein ARMSODRAFT_1022445 [Armillaria solidipes]|uniref:Uncharacterized protein n=1 Tax=Armillaria solidipes TaxID=1076256 RepID=A0A2H3B387_9AGAR|nr:hypothetical protein ARMSODRAFT_1022445 [Armillaria solidipes]
MPALNVSLQAASLIEASGVPYIDKLAKVAVAIRATGEQKNKEDVKEQHYRYSRRYRKPCLYAWRARSGVLQGYLCRDGKLTGRYLTGIADDLKDAQRKPRRIKGFLKVSDLRDTIQGYRKHVDNLKIDVLIHISGDSMLALIEIHRMLSEMRNMKETAPKDESVIIRITIIRADFFCIRALVCNERSQLTAPYKT